jgi:hypothetical protein
MGTLIGTPNGSGEYDFACETCGRTYHSVRRQWAHRCDGLDALAKARVAEATVSVAVVNSRIAQCLSCQHWNAAGCEKWPFERTCHGRRIWQDAVLGLRGFPPCRLFTDPEAEGYRKAMQSGLAPEA